MRIAAIIGAAVVLLAAQAAFAQVPEATVTPPDWPKELTYEFAIHDGAGTRVATAYYRILQEESEGRPVYWLKYVGRNEQMSEASECWVYRDTLLPLRSTRKVISGGRTFFQDVGYSNGVITVRRKYEGEEVTERELPAPNTHYDYEELIWLVPQLDFQGQSRVRFNLFSTITERQATVIATDVGILPLTIDGSTYDAHHYAFEVNMAPYKLWTVMQDGRSVTARLQMGNTTFTNMRLDPKKAGAVQAVAPQTPPPAEKPKEPPKEKPKEPEETPSDPNVNPLGPPPPGSRF